MQQTVSKPSYKKLIMIIAGLTLLALAMFVGYQKLSENVFSGPESDTDLIQPEIAIPPVDVIRSNQPAPYSAVQAQTESEIDLMVAELAERMRQEFADTIHQIATQVSLKGLRDDLVRTYPEQGKEIFERIVSTAFPEWLAAILKALSLMDEYEAWLQSVLLDLNDMNLLQQQGLLWEKRRELFGDAATQIWQEEISAEQERQQTMHRTIEMLDRSYDTQMQERLYLLKSTFEENYANQISSVVFDSKGVLTQTFFSFDSVQRDLSALPPEERQAQINEIRKTMGFSEEQIQTLAEADQKREKRWQNGYAYMEARKVAESTYSGDDLVQELDKIREKFFAHEASTIKKEEQELEFYRYQRPRVYGRN